jgi:GAF domain-containing protein
LELYQLQLRQGPCFQAASTGRSWVSGPGRSVSGSWPELAGAFDDAGVVDLAANPLIWHGETIGALNLFSTSEGRIDANDGKVIQALADVATIGLLQQRAIAHGEILTEQLQVALASRVSIEQAKGALARMRRVSVDEAFTLMRTHARQNHLKLTDLALAVIHDPASQPALTGVDLG